jgi:PAS domain S-box-containing protein
VSSIQRSSMQESLSSKNTASWSAFLRKKLFPRGNPFLPKPEDQDLQIQKIANILGVFPEAIFDAFFLETLDGAILDCNQKACEIYGYSKEEMLSLSVYDLVPAEIAKILPAVIRQEIESGSFRGEALGLRKNKEIFPVEISTKVFTTGDEKLVAVHVRDISESRRAQKALQQSEERYRNIFENSVEGIFQSTPEGTYHLVNPAFAKMFGFSSPQEMISSVKDISKLYVDPADRETVKNILVAEGVIKNHEARLKRKDGALLWISINARAIRDEAGKTLYYDGTVQDITERKQAEIACRSSEENYRLISENTSDFIVVMSFAPNPVFTYVSPSHKYFGYDQAELIGKAGLEFIHPEDKIRLEELLRRYLKKLLTEKNPVSKNLAEHVEFRFKDRSGNWRNLETTVNVVGENLILISKDITKSKETEARLKESERRFRETLDNVDLIAVQLDSTGAVTSCNDFLAELSGWSKQEILRRNWFDVFIPADKRQEIKAVFKEMIAGKSAMPNFYDNPIQIKSREIRLIRWANIRFFDLAGAVIGTSSIGIDITDSRLSEEKVGRELNKFKMLYELAVNMSAEKDLDENLEYIVFKTQELLRTDTCQIGLCDKDGVSIHIYTCAGSRTDAFRNMKFPSDKGISGMVLSSRKGDIFEDYFNDKRFEHVVDKIVAGEGLVSIMAVPIQTRKKNLGVLYAANRRKTQFTRDDLDTLQLLGNLAAVEIMRRESEQTLKLSYKELKGAQEALVQSEKMAAMGQLAAGISHELFQPLTGIKGFAQAALLDLDEKNPLFEYLTKIVEQSGRMETIIGNVRAFAKKTEFSLKPIDINCPIDDCLSLLGAQLKSHGIQVKKQLAGNLPKVNADANQLQQVFINLITNAKEALEQKGAAGEKEISIATSHNQSSGHVEAVFRDTGAGIPRQKLNKIFEPFYTSKPNGKSLGLGLSIVQRIIDNHSGKIAVESAPGKGTSFTVALPAREPLAQENLT